MHFMWASRDLPRQSTALRMKFSFCENLHSQRGGRDSSLPLLLKHHGGVSSFFFPCYSLQQSQVPQSCLTTASVCISVGNFPNLNCPGVSSTPNCHNGWLSGLSESVRLEELRTIPCTQCAVESSVSSRYKTTQTVTLEVELQPLSFLLMEILTDSFLLLVASLR